MQTWWLFDSLVISNQACVVFVYKIGKPGPHLVRLLGKGSENCTKLRN
jgi:hypothetical protein